MVEWIEQYSHRNMPPAESHNGMGSRAKNLRRLKVQIGRSGSRQQNARRTQSQRFQGRVQIAERTRRIAEPGLVHATVEAGNQSGVGVGLIGIGLRPCQFCFLEQPLVDQVHSDIVALIGSDERRLPIGLLRQQRVSDGLKTYARQLLQAFAAPHRFQRRGDTLLRTFVSAARSARRFLLGMGSRDRAHS